MIPKLYLKNGVVVNGAHFYPEMVAIINAARATAPLLDGNAVWITSAADGQHMEGSLHYENRAFDIRTKNISGYSQRTKATLAQEWVAKMKLALGDKYDIVFEKDHIHCEHDPKEI